MSLFYQLQDAKETISELEELNKRYCEALAEIASESEWETVDEVRAIARKALERDLE